ncbi:hypothetical protein DFJ77DRAFT_514554 [Powellomyces hirtus]|nr:hypothetical protein DFJ77DRAFT_514554 [Powellomyces hirtus]
MGSADNTDDIVGSVTVGVIKLEVAAEVKEVLEVDGSVAVAVFEEGNKKVAPSVSVVSKLEVVVLGAVPIVVLVDPVTSSTLKIDVETEAVTVPLGVRDNSNELKMAALDDTAEKSEEIDVDLNPAQSFVLVVVTSVAEIVGSAGKVVGSTDDVVDSAALFLLLLFILLVVVGVG